MKTGIIRRVDDLGRVVIPKEIRRNLGIIEGDPLEISLDGNKISFELYVPSDDYDDKITRIIENLEQDEYLTSNKREVISALKNARQILRSGNDDGF